MEDRVREELDIYLKMLRNWSESYKNDKWLSAGGDNDWVIEELGEDVNQWMAPCVRRFLELEYITAEEREKFVGEVNEIMGEFANFAKNYGGEKKWKMKESRMMKFFRKLFTLLLDFFLWKRGSQL